MLHLGGGGVYTYQLSVRLNIGGGVDQYFPHIYLILAEYEIGVLWNRILLSNGMDGFSC